MKKWFKEHFTKDKIVSLILTGVIILLVLLIVFFENQDKKNMENKQSEISLCDTEINLNTSWTINNEGNLVGNNLLNVPNKSGFDSGITFTTSNQTININGSNPVGTYPYFSINSVSLNSGTYTISKSVDNRGIYMWVGSVIETGNIIDTNNVSATFTLESSLVVYVAIVSTSGQVYDNVNFTLMLNEGSTALSWEPYLSMV